MRKLIATSVVFISFCFNNQLMSQDKNEIQSLSQISHFADTLDINVYRVSILVTWLTDTIELNSLVSPVKYNLEYARKYRKDSTFTPTVDEVNREINFIKTASQNCYSNALQHYFNYNNIEADILFNKDIALTRKAFETIINHTFIKTKEFYTKKSKHFKDEVDDGTLIVFRNKSNWMTHTFYYENGVFYSKNGGWELTEYKKMKDIYKRYWDTALVEFYELNESKISDFLNSNG